MCPSAAEGLTSRLQDQEVESRVAEAHEEEWSRTAAVQQEKAELEEKITQLERERGEKMAALSGEVQVRRECVMVLNALSMSTVCCGDMQSCTECVLW